MVGENGGLGDKPVDLSQHVLLTPDLDRILDSLRNRRRRFILLLLKERGVTNQDGLLVRSKEDTKTVELELVHTHLPVLEEAGYIEWDRDTGDISKGPHFDEIEPVLELIINHADELPPDWP